MSINSNIALRLNIVNDKYEPISGLEPVNKKPSFKQNIAERVALLEARSLNFIDYVFFRRFSDYRSSQVAAYIVDNSMHNLTEQDLAQLHRQVWLQGTAPLLYVIWPTRIDVLSCARGPDFWVNNDIRYKHYSSVEDELALLYSERISNQLHELSLIHLANGTFWDNPIHKDVADYTKAAHQSLIQAIVDTDKELNGEQNPVLRRLLLLVVLIKYLEDRNVFPKNWFKEFHPGANSFLEVIETKDSDIVYKLLRKLEKKFNGDVFSLPKSRGKVLTKKQLSTFAMLIEGKTLNRQINLWKLFSFEHIPVEIISHLYQRFAKTKKGAVYTPPFLASLLLDYAMPYSKLLGKERILDPSMGSGIFLVGAFKRLINVWRSQHKWKKPDVNILKKILNKSIFGVELESNAIHLTAFSLSLALCDALQPDVVWKELKFDPLNTTNLFEADFFNKIIDSRTNKHSIFNQKFDVIIGNPPFVNHLSEPAKTLDIQNSQSNISRGKIPRNQIGYLFLEEAAKLLNKGGTLCLIQPHGLLYNLQTHQYRNFFLKNFSIATILDFCSVRNLYDNYDPKTVAIILKNEISHNHGIDHIIFRRSLSVKERICFEIDHYDYHYVNSNIAISDPLVWRINLLGGGRLHRLSRRLRTIRTLEDYLKTQHDWDYGEGFEVKIKSKKSPATFLTGKPFLPTKAFSVQGINEKLISKVKEKEFYSHHTPKRYTAPLLLIKESDTLPIAFWDNGFLAYKDSIIGITAPKKQKNDLKKIYNFIVENHRLYQFFCILHGFQSLIGRSTATLKNDIYTLPLPENYRDIQLSFWEQILCQDVLDYIADYVRLGQNSDLLQKKATITNIKEYSTTFCTLLGSIYNNIHPIEPIFRDGIICQGYYFGKKPKKNWKQIIKNIDIDFEKILYKDHHKHLRSVRLFRYYDKNMMLIFKPNLLRYWIRSTAIRDADETIKDLQDMGY